MLNNKRSVVYLLLIACCLIPLLLTACKDDPPEPPDPVPTGISVVNGDIYKAVMGTSQTDEPIEFIVRDNSGDILPNQWVHFLRLIGDGTLVNDSLLTNSSGIVTCQYTFDGNFGHAIISALVREIDTIMVEVRANTLIDGVTGQGQYILMEDTYADVLEWLGAPDRVDPDPSVYINYAVYESTLGVVVMLLDPDSSETASADESVYGVIVNTVYDGKTKDSIGIGSTRAAFSAIYGVAPGNYDPTPPPAYYYLYPNYGLTFWTDTNSVEANRVVFEMHVTENVIPPAPKKDATSINASGSSNLSKYRYLRK